MYSEMKYAGFLRRVGAFGLDLLIWLPVIGFSMWGSEQSRLFQVYWIVPSFIVVLWFHVYLVKRFGGTPGKLLLKIVIAKLDGSAVGYKEGLLRYAVSFMATVILAAMLIPVVLGMTDAEYFSFSRQERIPEILSQASVWYLYISVALTIWIYSEFLVMLTNNKRRSFQDYMAGTVVIEKNGHAVHHFDLKAMARN